MSKAKISAVTYVIAVAFAGVCAWLGWSFWRAIQPQPVLLQGQIEARQYGVGSKIAGRIDKMLVHKGDHITKGQLVYTIISPELEAKLEQARAGAGAADAMVEQADNGPRAQQLAAARDQWQKAEAASRLGEKTFNRVDSLYRDGVLAEQKRDEVYTRWQAAKFTENAAHQMYLMALEGARKETRQAARQKLKMAKGALAEVEAFQAETRVSSWHQGEVAEIILHDGELAPKGFPVVTIVDLGDIWAELNVREDQLKHFSMGTHFQARIPALGDQLYTFEVTHLAVMGDFATWRTTDTRKGFDMRTFNVEARPVQAIDNLRPGMSILVN